MRGNATLLIRDSQHEFRFKQPCLAKTEGRFSYEIKTYLPDNRSRFRIKLGTPFRIAHDAVGRDIAFVLNRAGGDFRKMKVCRVIIFATFCDFNAELSRFTGVQ